MPFDSQCVTDSVGSWDVAFVASVVFCGGANVPVDGVMWYPTFVLICCFVDHYFGPGGGTRGFRLKSWFPKMLAWAERFGWRRDDRSRLIVRSYCGMRQYHSVAG